MKYEVRPHKKGVWYYYETFGSLEEARKCRDTYEPKRLDFLTIAEIRKSKPEETEGFLATLNCIDNTHEELSRDAWKRWYEGREFSFPIPGEELQCGSILATLDKATV